MKNYLLRGILALSIAGLVVVVPTLYSPPPAQAFVGGICKAVRGVWRCVRPTVEAVTGAYCVSKATGPSQAELRASCISCCGNPILARRQAANSPLPIRVRSTMRSEQNACESACISAFPIGTSAPIVVEN